MPSVTLLEIFKRHEGHVDAKRVKNNLQMPHSCLEITAVMEDMLVPNTSRRFTNWICKCFVEVWMLLAEVDMLVPNTAAKKYDLEKYYLN